MIRAFKHKGLDRFHASGNTKGVQAKRANKPRMQLAALDTAHYIDDLDIPGYRLHQLKGSLKGIWPISINPNWRITFEFSDGNVYIVNYEVYH